MDLFPPVHPVKPIHNTDAYTNGDTNRVNVKSWVGLLKPSFLDFMLTYIKLESCKQARKLSVPSVISNQASREWHNTLVGFFLDRKLPYSLVVQAITKF